jgi:hypothetical protein
MTASTANRPLFASLDARISSALVVLRHARLAVAHSPTPAALQEQARAEENLDALLDFRNALSSRSR